MRLKQLQQMHPVQTHYRLYKSGKNWCAVLVTLVGGSCLGAALLVQPITANAATTPALTTTASTATTATTSIGAASAESTSMSASAVATSVAVSSAVSATSTAASAATTSASSVPDLTNSTMPASTAATSLAMSSTPVSTASSAVSLTSNNTSQQTSASAVSSGGTLVSSAATTSTDSTSSNVVPDTTIVTFGDAGIASAVQTALGTTGPITVGELRNYQQPVLSIGTDNNILTVTGSLSGMQYLQYLPAKTTVQLVTKYLSPDIDLTPLIPVHFSEIGIMIQNMAAVNLAPLLKTDPSQINEIQLISSVISDNSDYQKNSEGLTNAQLAELGPWLTAIDENDMNKSFNFNEGSLTDFSPLSGFTKMAYIVAVGQRVNVAQPVNLVTGQPAVFAPMPIIGLQGESLTSKYEVTWNGTNPAPAGPSQTPLTKLADGRFEIPTAYQAVPNADWFTYGFHGLVNFNGNRADFIQAKYPNNITLRYDSMIYQLANWQAAPQVYIRYVNPTTKQVIQPYTINPGTTIGSTYDFTKLTQLANYRFLPATSSSPTGTYTQDPQYLTFNFAKVPVSAGGLTVNYVDPAGQKIAPSTTLTGKVGDVYSSTPIAVTNYVYRQLASTSLAASGTLPLKTGEIIYQYAPISLQRTIIYLDTTTQRILASATITGNYQSTVSDPTLAAIKRYQTAGYNLVSNEFPATASPFATPALTRTYTVKLAHRLVTLQPTAKLPANVSLTRVIAQTISFKTATGKVLAPRIKQQVSFERTAVIDQVTGVIQYSPWRATVAPELAAVTVPQLADYRANLARIAPIEVTAASPDVNETVIYQPKSGTVAVHYQLAGTNQSLATTKLLTGNADHPFTATAPIIAGYQLAANQSAMITGDYPAGTEMIHFDYVRVPEQLMTSKAVAKRAVARPTIKPLVTSTTSVTSLVAQHDQAGKHKLPQTSERRSGSIWGILGLTLIGLIGGLRHRKGQ